MDELRIPENTLKRLQALYSQQQAIQQQVQEIMAIVVEMLQLEGPHNADIATGVITPDNSLVDRVPDKEAGQPGWTEHNTPTPIKRSKE